MTQPLVSIVIPCFNAEQYVGEAIQSALGQTYRNVEVIVIDDGSTDSSLEVIRSFGSRVRWETGPNRGGCAARNRGLALARGELIQFLDADDLIHPNKLLVQIESANGEDLLLSRGVEIDLNGNHLGEVGRPYETTFLRMACLDLLTVLGPLMRREAIRSVGGFCVGLPRGQERDLFLRMALAGATHSVCLDQVLFTVRRVPKSVSSHLENSIDIYETVFYQTYIDKQATGRLSDAQCLALADAMVQGATYYARCGCRAKALRYLGLAKSMHPRAGQHLSWKRRAAQRVLGFCDGVLLTDFLGQVRNGLRGRPKRRGSD